MIEQRVKTRAEVIERGIFIDDADLQIRVTQVVVDKTFRSTGVLDAQEVALAESNAETPLHAIGRTNRRRGETKPDLVWEIVSGLVFAHRTVLS